MSQKPVYTGKEYSWDSYNATQRAKAMGGDERGFFNKASNFANTGASGFFPGGFDKLKNWFHKSKLTNRNDYGWSKGSGLKAFGKNVGKWGNVASGVMQGADFLQGIGNYSDTVGANGDLISKIQTSAMGNPLLSSYLTQDQLNLLGDIQLGNYGTDADTGGFLKGAVGGIDDAILPTLLGFATGGIPGAVIGGVGTLINSGVDGLSGAAGQNTAELQALYQALQDADMQYKSMKRPNFTGLGIQQRYQDIYA